MISRRAIWGGYNLLQSFSCDAQCYLLSKPLWMAKIMLSILLNLMQVETSLGDQNFHPRFLVFIENLCNDILNEAKRIVDYLAWILDSLEVSAGENYFVIFSWSLINYVMFLVVISESYEHIANSVTII